MRSTNNRDCRIYQRHDSTASIKKITLSARHWALIESTQRDLARTRSVRRVSISVALHHILDEALKAGICHHQPIRSKEK